MKDIKIENGFILYKDQKYIIPKTTKEIIEKAKKSFDYLMTHKFILPSVEDTFIEYMTKTNKETTLEICEYLLKQKGYELNFKLLIKRKK